MGSYRRSIEAARKWSGVGRFSMVESSCIVDQLQKMNSTQRQTNDEMTRDGARFYKVIGHSGHSYICMNSAALENNVTLFSKHFTKIFQK